MSLPTPITRKESYLAAIAGEQVQVPEKPITREEAYLDAIAKGGGGGEIIVDPVPTQGSTNAVSSGGTYTALEGKLDASEKGTASGVAELDANGKVLSSQLPSFVDDVVEGYYDSETDRFYEESTFETVIDPVGGKSWVDIPANKSYRWTGTVYVRVDEGVQIGDTSNSAFRGDWGKALKDTMGTGTLDTEAQTVIGAVNELKGAMPTDLADLEGDSTHRTVTDTEKAEWSGKQDSLTFDTTPTEDSENPVTSGGIKTAIDDSVSLKTATGNPIILTDAANANAEKLLMTIEPVQDLHGYSKPWAGGAGKNKLQVTATSTTISGVTFTVNDDGTVEVNGTATNLIVFRLSSSISLTQGTDYKLSGCTTDTFNCRLDLTGNTETSETYANIINDTSFTAGQTSYRSSIIVNSGYTVNNVIIKPMIRLATETDATFAPYSNICPISGLTSGEVTTTNGTDTNTATISLGQTVYGGSVNFKTCEVTVTHGVKTYDGITQTNWTVVQYTNLCAFIPLSEVGTGHRTFILSNIFKSYETITNKPNGTNGISIEGISSGVDGVFVGISDLATDINSWLLYLQEHPLTICYELATPTTLTLTPAELELLKGNNTITANGAEISIKYYPNNAIGALAEKVDKKADITYVDNAVATKVEIQNNAGFHNSIYRGKSLGSEVTAEQYAAIAAGTFEDMYIGDYWTIGGVNYRIAHFDYWLNTGDTNFTTHHVVIVPDTNFYTAKMNDTNITTGAYVGSAMRTANLAQAKTTINNAFGASHILNHREYLANAMKATADPTYESAGSWYNSTVELMNERMIYGADVFHNVEVNGAIPFNYTIDKSQLALFALDPSRICNRATWWLRCAVSAEYFASVGNDGNATYFSASASLGVRPAFGIKAEE